MTTTQGNLAGLSRFIFRMPRWYTSLTFALVVAALTGVAVFDTRFILEDMWQGVFFVGVPTVVASALTSVVDRSLGGRLTPNRSSFLALACEIVVVATLVAAGGIAVVSRVSAGAVGPVPALGQNFVFDALLVGLASIFGLRLLILMSVSRHRPVVAAVPAAVQTAVAAVLLFVYSGTVRYLELSESTGPVAEAFLARHEEVPPELRQELLVLVPGDFLRLALLCGLYAVAVVAFVRVIDRPWQRSLGVSVLDFIGGFIGHMAEGTDELENFFEDIGEEAMVPVTVMAARNGDGEEVLRFVLPMIHPGPMGEIGGGSLPLRVAREAEGLCFPPHATAGHDFNLVTDREVDTVLAAADSAHRDLDYDGGLSRAVRTEVGEASVLAQAVGDDLLVVSTFAPGFADDVEYSVGLSAAAEARSAGFDDVLLVDAHNCNDGLEGGDIGHVVPGSARSFDLMRAVETAADELATAPRTAARAGVAWTETDWTPEEGVGPLGVRVATLTVDGQTTAYVLVDGNNMEPGVRARLLSVVRGLDAVDHAEAMTTDNHVVNTMDSENQVGDRIDADDLADVVERVTREALASREPVELGMASEHAEVTVFGNDRTETLASTANAMVSMGFALAGIVILASVSLSALVFLLF
jgi:putative membrane protein